MTPQYRLAWWICRFLVALRARLLVEGVEHLPAGGCIVASNHVSNWDPVMLGLAVPHRQLRALGKQELFDIPLLGRIAAWTGGIAIRRGEADRDALMRCKNALAEGQGLILLPEGTRSTSGALTQGKPGIIMLAQLAQVPIVPAGVSGTMALGWPWRRTTVRVRFGPPITVERKARQPEQRQTALDQTMAAIARLLPPRQRGVYAEAAHPEPQRLSQS